MGKCVRCGMPCAWDGLCPKCQQADHDYHVRMSGGDRYEDYFTRLKKQQEQQSTAPRVSPTITAKPLNGYIRKKWYRNGDLYRGYMKDNKRHGKGKWTKADTKYTYDGDWYMDKRHGHGEENMPGEWRFSGEFYNGKRNGFGKLICSDGESYEGEWKDDKKHGFGKLIFSNGNWYEGEFFESKYSGKGTYFDASRNRTYEGEFKNGKINGYAVERCADGSIYEGYFVDNVKTGKGKKIAPDGTVTVGHWEGGSFVIDSAPISAPQAEDIADLWEKTSAPDDEFDVSPESLASFLQNGTLNGKNDGDSSPAESAGKAAEETLAVNLLYDFQKRFIYFDQALYGIDRNGVLHISSKMKKNKEIIEAYNGKSGVSCLACCEAQNIIIIGSNGSVLFADSTWKKGLLADKEVKAALPEVLNWSGLSAAACGNWHFVGLRHDGTVIGAGKKMCHLDEVSRWENVKDIACCEFGTVGLCEDGTVLSCGLPDNISRELSEWRDISAIACGKSHVVGLRKNGTVTACGKNDSGQCDVGNFSNVGMISASGQCTALVFNDGTIKAVGKYANASIVVERGIIAAVCSNFGNILRLDTYGSIRGDFSGVDLAEFKKDFEW